MEQELLAANSRVGELCLSMAMQCAQCNDGRASIIFPGEVLSFNRRELTAKILGID